MIAKQSIGSSFTGALGYNLKKMNHPEREGRAELLATNFISLEKPIIKKEVDLVASLNPRLKKNTYHTSLNFAQGEAVSNEKMLAVAGEYMQQMGFDDNLYFIFRHHDSNHPHCHILALRTRFDGSTVTDSNNYKRSEEIIRQLERKYGLQQVADSGSSAFRAPDRDELEMVQRTGRASRKMVLQEKVSLALSESKNLKAFIAHLEKAGVRVLFNQASTGRVSGITYLMGDFKAKGQALGNQFKWANIIKTLDYEQARDSQEISQANRRTRAKYGEGISGRPGLVRPAGRDIEIIMDSQKALNMQQHSLGDGLSRKLASIDSLQKAMKDMENTQMDLVKQQQKAKKLLMTIFFTGIVPLLAFITTLVLKLWILT